MSWDSCGYGEEIDEEVHHSRNTQEESKTPWWKIRQATDKEKSLRSDKKSLPGFPIECFERIANRKQQPLGSPRLESPLFLPFDSHGSAPTLGKKSSLQRNSGCFTPEGSLPQAGEDMLNSIPTLVIEPPAALSTLFSNKGLLVATRRDSSEVTPNMSVLSAPSIVEGSRRFNQRHEGPNEKWMTKETTVLREYYQMIVEEKESGGHRMSFRKLQATRRADVKVADVARFWESYANYKKMPLCFRAVELLYKFAAREVLHLMESRIQNHEAEIRTLRSEQEGIESMPEMKETHASILSDMASHEMYCENIIHSLKVTPEEKVAAAHRWQKLESRLEEYEADIERQKVAYGEQVANLEEELVDLRRRCKIHKRVRVLPELQHANSREAPRGYDSMDTTDTESVRRRSRSSISLRPRMSMTFGSCDTSQNNIRYAQKITESSSLNVCIHNARTFPILMELVVYTAEEIRSREEAMKKLELRQQRKEISWTTKLESLLEDDEVSRIMSDYSHVLRYSRVPFAVFEAIWYAMNAEVTL